MAVTLLKGYRISFNDAPDITVYSENDLSSLDSAMHYCTEIKLLKHGGLGSDGITTHDGVIEKNEVPTVNKHTVLPRVTKNMGLRETERVLALHKSQ